MKHASFICGDRFHGVETSERSMIIFTERCSTMLVNAPNMQIMAVKLPPPPPTRTGNVPGNVTDHQQTMTQLFAYSKTLFTYLYIYRSALSTGHGCTLMASRDGGHIFEKPCSLSAVVKSTAVSTLADLTLKALRKDQLTELDSSAPCQNSSTCRCWDAQHLARRDTRYP